jgi:4-hydroxybenzoate polyprenyltransferase
MSLSLRRIIKISRSRFWLYVLGPYLLGSAAAIGSQISRIHWVVIAFAIFFTLPANLLIYGINDMFDYETDKDNPKKQKYEALVTPKEYTPLRHAILLVTIPFAFLLPMISPWAIIAMIGFLFFSIFYSAKPIRAKAKPFLDSLFNILYVFPGIFGFLLAGGDQLSWMYVAAGCLWCMAMHAYSAVPDIEADRTSGIETIATKLGATRTLALCGALYAFAGILASIAGLELIASILALVYVALIGISLWIPKDKLHAVYRYFPLVNVLAGFTIFVVIL